MPTFLPYRILFFAVFCLFAIDAGAQQSILSLKKLDAEILIDGKVDEMAWRLVEPLGVLQKVPDAGASPTQATELRMMYDDDNLYLSCRLFDEHPERIVANTKKRDDFTENTEWCGFLIDSYNDRENALAFFVTPTGAKLDMALSNDIEGPAAFNVSWNTYWDAAATVNLEGWFAEIKVPFSSLPFEAKAGKAIMGITAFRYLARNDETDIYPPRDPSLGSTFKPSLTQRFLFEDIYKHNPIHITPYLLSGLETVHTFSPAAGRFEKDARTTNQAGLDAKIALKSNATLDVTVNTDFAQVEADDQQVNLTRLNLFFPEKRLFFQERASLFDFNFGSTDKAFHSRRIGIVNGEQVRILGGVRLFGKAGKWEAGLLNMQTGISAREGENFGVFRLRRAVFNENSTMGLILTNRSDFHGNRNTLYGVDATLRAFKQNYLSLRIAQSLTDSARAETLSLTPSKLYVALEKRSLEHFTYRIRYSRAGAEYNPTIGFEQRENFSQLNYRTSYEIFPDSRSQLLQYGPYHESNFIWENTSRILESRRLVWGMQALTKSGWTYDLRYQHNREALADSLIFPGRIVIEEGTYAFGSLQGSVVTAQARDLSYTVTVDVGRFYTGRRFALNISSILNVTPDFFLEGSLDFNRIRDPNIDGPVDIRLAQFKAGYTLSTKLFLSGLIQFNNLTRTAVSNFRIRYNAREGNDFYLVYNADFNQDRKSVVPHLPRSNRGTLLVKYSHTFHR